MGVFGKLFGKGGARIAGEARCNECGMTAPAHTDWCPLVRAEEEGEEGEAGAGRPRPGDGRSGGGPR